jgi:mediator of RNA polymerase II transcription subunit 5
LTDEFISLGDRRLSASFLQSTPFVHSLDNLTREDTITFNTWFKALFDYNSDGIEDTMFR